MESFVEVCRQNYFQGITPSNILSHQKEGYKKIVNIAKQQFNDNKYSEFAAGFADGEYLISLWVAHMLLEYGTPDEKLTAVAIKMIENYSNNPIVSEVAKEERVWLQMNAAKYV